MNLIDKELKRVYAQKPKYGELAALFGIFDKGVQKAIIKELSVGLKGNPNFKQEIHTNTCWIDKNPLAEFKPMVQDVNNNQITSRTEIGDLDFPRYSGQ